MPFFSKILVLFIFKASLFANNPIDIIYDSIIGELSVWDSFNGETLQSKESARRNYEEKCANWKVEVRRLMGKKLRYLECGQRNDAQVGPTLYAPNPVPYLIGNLSYSNGTILVNTPPNYNISKFEKKLSGEAFSFDVQDFKSVLSAFANAKKSYDSSCKSWKSDVEKEFDDSLVLASCGGIAEIFFPTISNDPLKAWRSKFVFSSQSIIYYFQRKER